MRTAPGHTDQPAPGTRLVYRVGRRECTGVVQDYQPGTGPTFPVKDEPGFLHRMMLPAEVVRIVSLPGQRESTP